VLNDRRALLDDRRDAGIDQAFRGHESERDNLVSRLADNRDGGQGGGSAPQGKRQVVGGEVPQVHGAGYVRDALDGCVDATRGAGVVKQLLFLFGERKLKRGDVFQIAEGAILESRAGAVQGHADLCLADKC
jgi:hypothetical protein